MQASSTRYSELSTSHAISSSIEFRKMSDRVWAKSDDGRFKWVSLTPKYLSQTLDVYVKSFCVNESISSVIGLSSSKKGTEQFCELLTEIAQDGVSIIAVEIATDKVVGAALNKLQYKGNPEPPILQKYCDKKDIDPVFKELLNFMNQLEAKVDIFKYYGVSNLMDFMFLATHPDYYRIGIGVKTVATTVEVAKALQRGEDIVVPLSEATYTWKNIPPPRPEIVIALFTSFISQKIGKNLGWEIVTDVSYDDLFYKGKSYSSVLDKKSTCTVYMATKIFGK